MEFWNALKHSADVLKASAEMLILFADVSEAFAEVLIVFPDLSEAFVEVLIDFGNISEAFTEVFVRLNYESCFIMNLSFANSFVLNNYI